MARLNKSTGLFGMGGGKRGGAKSGVGDFLDQLKKKRKRKQLSKSNAKSREDDAQDIYKYSKKDSIKAYKAKGMSRSEAKDQTMVDAKAKVRSNRSNARAEKASAKLSEAEARKVEADKRRTEARRTGQKLAYDVNPTSSPAEQREKAPGGTPTRKMKMKSGDKVSKEKGMYKITGADGYVRYSESEPEIMKTRKNKAMYGAKVKAVKKAQEGAKVKAKSFGVLKSDTKMIGPKMEDKRPFSKNGINYTWDRKNSVWMGDLDKKKSRAVKKAKDGAKISKSERLQQKDKNLKSKATTAYEEGKDKKGDRIQNRRLRVQKRENKAFIKDFKTAKNGAKVTDPPKKKQTLSDKKLIEDVELMDFKMRGLGRPEDAESAKMIAKSDNTRTNKVTVKGEEKGYGPDNDYRRQQDVKKFNHEYSMKNDSKYRIAYKKKLKSQYDAEDETYRRKEKQRNNNKKTVKVIKKNN